MSATSYPYYTISIANIETNYHSKTTLLNALAQRLDFGVVTGDFLVDGK